MTVYWLKFRLLSDATFGRGDGLAGVVDAEVQHDEYGLPYLSGKTLKGLLGAECAEILFALQHCQKPEALAEWRKAAASLFGGPGSGATEAGLMHVDDARLPRSLRAEISQEFTSLNDSVERATRQRNMLESLTALRRQTAMDAVTGAPKTNTLRTMRVILRETPFEAELTFPRPADEREWGLLAACVRAFRRAGTGRNRGRGRLTAELYETYPGDGVQPVTGSWFDLFRKAVQQ